MKQLISSKMDGFAVFGGPCCNVTPTDLRQFFA